MKKQHLHWLNLFLENCRETNKSSYTIINYRCDLQKFIIWYEKTQSGLLNKANAQTISTYKSYLNRETSKQLATKSSSQKTGREKPLQKIKSFFKKLFKIATPSPPQEKMKELEVIHRPLLPLPSDVLGLQGAYAVTSRRRHLSAIKNFYEFLKQSHEDEGNLFPINPVKPKLHAIKLKDEDVENTKLLTREDWRHITALPLRPREKLVVNLLYYGGLRLSEVSDLTVSAFDRTKRSLTFVRKGGYVHTLYIQQDHFIFTLLDHYLAVRPRKVADSPHLFPGRYGRALTSKAMYNLIIKIIKQGVCPTVGLTPHSFRKACASNLYEQSKDLLLVRDYLNHADAKVTQTYIERIGRSEQKY